MALPLIGRDAELATVRRLVAATAAGAGGVLAVLGEAGIGKSRLLSAVSSVATRAGLTVHTGRAVEGNGSYRAVAQALAGLSTPLSPALRPYRAALGLVVPAWRIPDMSLHIDPAVLLGEGLVRLLDGAVLVLDDLQWADPETAALVTYLAEAARHHRLLVVAAIRTDEPSPALTPTPAMATLTLDRLGPDDAARMAEMLGSAAVFDVVLAAAGLPLVIEELAAEPSSASLGLAAIVRARMDRLTATQRDILAAAALLGDEPDWTRLPAVTGHPEPFVLDALDAAHGPLLVPDPARPGQLTWRHRLIREHVLATLTGPQRSGLANRAAIALGDDPVAAELFVLAGAPARATALLLALARREPSGPGALALLDRAEPTPAVTAERVRLLTALGRAPEALELGRDLLGRLRGNAHAAACLDLAEAAVATRRWADARRYLDRAGRPEDPRSLVIAADAAFGPGDLAEARRLAEGVPDGTADVRSLIHAHVVRARCDVRTDPAAGRALYGRAAQLAAEHGLAAHRVTALLGLATVDLDEDAPPAALSEARDLALDTGQLAQVVWLDHLEADRAIVRSGPVAAEPAARRAVERAEQLRLSGLLAVGEAYLALCRQLTGDTAGARTLLARATARPAAPLEVAAAVHVVDALRHVLAHDLRPATAALEAGLRPLLGHAETAPLFAFGLWALLSTVAGSPPRSTVDSVGASTVDLIAASPAAGRIANRAGLLYARAVLDRDPAGLAAADRVLPATSWWRRLLRLVALEAAVDGGWGDPVPALRIDLEAFVAGGDEQLARTARDLLRRAGAPTRRGRGAATVPDRLRAAGVTSREMDVLRLVGAGLSNREIAERLFLSPRTVETHVARLLAKTGTATRGGLGALSP